MGAATFTSDRSSLSRCPEHTQVPATHELDLEEAALNSGSDLMSQLVETARCEGSRALSAEQAVLGAVRRTDAQTGWCAGDVLSLRGRRSPAVQGTRGSPESSRQGETLPETLGKVSQASHSLGGVWPTTAPWGTSPEPGVGVSHLSRALSGVGTGLLTRMKSWDPVTCTACDQDCEVLPVSVLDPPCSV